MSIKNVRVFFFAYGITSDFTYVSNIMNPMIPLLLPRFASMRIGIFEDPETTPDVLLFNKQVEAIILPEPWCISLSSSQGFLRDVSVVTQDKICWFFGPKAPLITLALKMKNYGINELYFHVPRKEDSLFALVPTIKEGKVFSQKFVPICTEKSDTIISLS